MAISIEQTLLDGYRRQPELYDEFMDDDGKVRPHWRYLADALGSLGSQALSQRQQEARRLLGEGGVTYNVYGDPQGLERPWELDPVPFLVSSDEWAEIESGLVQRAELLNLILQDLYGPQELIKRGLLPLELVYAHGGFLRPCHPLSGTEVHPLAFYAADLARGPDGRMWVLSDRTQAPSGSGYALENRVVMTRILPSLFRDSHVHRLALFFQNLRAGIAALAPRRDTEPRVVVLTPGPLNETYFEHSFLASYLGYTLVQGDDLTVRDGRVWLRSMKRLEPVDVIIRRVDDDFCDPLELRRDSRLGVPGLLEAVRRGNVRVVNPLGASLLENPGIDPFLPVIAEHFFGHELELPSVATWWCGQEKERGHVLANLERMVIKPIHRGSEQPLFGALMTREERESLARRIRAYPHLYVGQEQVSFSAVPALVDGRLEPRQAVLRSFLTARGDGYVVMPGGLTRIAPSQDTVIVSNQAGGLSKDTWILATEPEKQASLLPTVTSTAAAPAMRGALPGGTADNLFWMSRYAERAEQSVRLLRTVLRVYRNATEYRGPADQACLCDLLRALTHLTASYPGFVGAEAKARCAQPEAELLSLVVDMTRVGTVSFNLQGLLAAAYAVRDRLSADTWRIVNGIRARLERLQAQKPTGLYQVHDLLDGLVTDLIALSGGAQESMLRAQAWQFMDMGRRIERALLLASLLRSTVIARRDPQVEALLLEAVLRSAETLMAYRRGYHDQPRLDAVLGLLLFDDTNPRSLAYQLQALQSHVDNLPRDEGVHMSEEQRLVLDAVTRLRLSRTDELVGMDDQTGNRRFLDALLRDLIERLGQTSMAVARDYFADVRGPRQLSADEGEDEA